ncbi:MAG: 16S rRNA (adenine(1518)-N(6)/adenine(1519)-N(6))-dimethyltransferase, partial [Marinoscillum sp.]
DIGVDYNFYKKIIKQSFQNRRKTLRNSLKNLNLPLAFIKNNIFSKRAEQLKISEFIWLAIEIKKINHEILPN